ncbi:hypothetical protein [Streptomyces griseorubiginosus]|uniref:hypothetical protein n=1 Tax=Streptomyces griseorubiginosus TaxID=67304 RepID=UPI00331CBBBD
MDVADIGKTIARLEREIANLKRSSRLGHASIENAAVLVNDGAGSLRGIVGVQSDGTTAVNIVNGAAPPQPSAPIVTSVLGGVTVSWDGTFAGGSVLPLDWSRVEVHASTVNGFTPVAATLQDTIETAQGATVVVPCGTGVYVRLVARNTSGTASVASVQVGPFGPTPVVAADVLDGIVTTVKLADQAVSAAKVKVGAIGTDQMALGVGNLCPDPSFEGAYTASLIVGKPDWTLVTPGYNSAKALHVDCTSATTAYKNLVLARLKVLPGERHYIGVDYKTSATYNGSGTKVLFRYEDAAATVLGYGVAEGTAIGGAWARVTAQVQAPANAVTAVLMVEASAVTAGEAWFDNVEVSTLIVAGKVAAGSITATEIAALTILAGNIAADAVAAGKIAADAVTAREIAALAVTAAEIAANTITAGKLAAGAVDATALAADAITGKTITGGTITGSLLQTAASGQRITLNEAGANKVIVYNSSGTAIGELSATGLLVKGTNGSLLWLDPNNAYPNLRLTNAAQSNSAFVYVSEGTVGAADLISRSGIFTGSGFTDMYWRTFCGNDFWVADRVRFADSNTNIGGRIFLANDHATLAYQDTTTPANNNSFLVYTGFAQLNGGRLEVVPPASANTALYVNAATGHTGPLLKLRLNSVDKFTVDKDGKVAASNLASGHVTITPSAANTPTSINVTGLNLVGTPRVVATAGTSLPGTQVTGVGVTNVTTTGFTIWVTRTNTTSTGIDWIVLCE